MTTVFFLISLATLDVQTERNKGFLTLFRETGGSAVAASAPFFSLSTISCHQTPLSFQPIPRQGPLSPIIKPQMLLAPRIRGPSAAKARDADS